MTDEQDGAGPFQTTTNRRRRWSTATAYLRPARNRTNLTVATNALATRVVFENGRATGVEYLGNGGPSNRAGARRGDRLRRRLQFAAATAIVRARAGRAAARPAASRWCATCPAVGADLQDHFYVRLAFRCTKPITLNDVANNPLRKGRRRAAVHAVPDRAVDQQRDLRRRLCAQRPASRTARHPAQFQLVELCRAQPGKASYPHPFPGFTVSAVHLRPDARGEVRVKSADPLSRPGDPLQLPEDPLRFAGADRRHAAGAQDRQAAGALRLCRRGTDPGRGCQQRRRVRGRRSARTASPTCTLSAPAGWATDEAAVLDPRLRVDGIGASARRRRLGHAVASRPATPTRRRS